MEINEETPSKSREDALKEIFDLIDSNKNEILDLTEVGAASELFGTAGFADVADILQASDINPEVVGNIDSTKLLQLISKPKEVFVKNLKALIEEAERIIDESR